MQKFVRRECPPEYAAACDREGRPPTSAFRALATEGWLGVSLPEAAGGAGGDLVDLATLLEELGRGCLDLALWAFRVIVYGGHTILRFGTPAQQARFVPAAARGDLSVAFGLTEPGSGSDAASLSTTATRRGEAFVLRGQKMFTSGMDVSDVVLLVARTDPAAPKHRGISCFLVDCQSPGITVQRLETLGHRAIATTAVFLDDVPVPEDRLLGALNGFEESEKVAVADMPPLEQFILHRLWQLDAEVRKAYEEYRFSDVVRPLLEFCQGDLSTFFFDIRKDALYCDRPDSLRRRACRTVMDAVFERLTIWLSPLIPFTTEEAWTTRYPDAGSNSLRVFPETPDSWRNDAEAARWGRVERVVSAVTNELELARREKRIGSSLEAKPSVEIDPASLQAFEGIDASEIFRTSGVDLSEAKAGVVDLPDTVSAFVRFQLADGCKCNRCWRVLPEVKPATQLCLRCEDAVEVWDKTHTA